MALNNLCAVAVSPADSVLVLLIGMLVIFSVLTIIIFIVKGYVGFFKLMDLSKKPKVEKKATTVEVKEEPVAIATTNDDELIAVITAAIAAVYASSSDDGEVPPFRVKNIFLK